LTWKESESTRSIFPLLLREALLMMMQLVHVLLLHKLLLLEANVLLSLGLCLALWRKRRVRKVCSRRVDGRKGRVRQGVNLGRQSSSGPRGNMLKLLRRRCDVRVDADRCRNNRVGRALSILRRLLLLLLQHQIVQV